jgi:protein TonB
MPRDLFGDVSHPSVRLGSQSRYTVTVSLLVHVMVIITLVLVPLMATGALPAPRSVTIFVAKPVLPEPPPPPRAAPPERPMPVTPDAAPVDAPETIQPETGLEPGFEHTIDSPGVIDGGVPGDASAVLTPPPPPPPPPQPLLRVGGKIAPPAKVREVAPVYPAIAQAARVSGMVILEAVIGEDGRVRDVRVLKSIPLLDQAAVDAVRQWEYSPTLLNGVPVPVVMTVTVRFDLR